MNRYPEYEAILKQMEEVQGTIEHMIAANNLPWFFDVATNLFMVLDSRGRVIQTNKAWVDLLGLPSFSEIDRIHFLEIVHPSDLERTQLSWQDRGSEDGVYVYNRYRRFDNTYVWVAWPPNSAYEDPATRYMHCIAEPVTDANLIYGLELNFGTTEQLYIP